MSPGSRPSRRLTDLELEIMQSVWDAHPRPLTVRDVVERMEGVSLGWGMPGWSKLTARLPGPIARLAVAGLDRIARQWPALADVIVVVGRPRRSESTSS